MNEERAVITVQLLQNGGICFFEEREKARGEIDLLFGLVQERRLVSEMKELVRLCGQCRIISGLERVDIADETMSGVSVACAKRLGSSR